MCNSCETCKDGCSTTKEQNCSGSEKKDKQGKQKGSCRNETCDGSGKNIEKRRCRHGKKN